ncbi:MAG: F420-dependent NADP oxidoreductase, partial [Chlorobi bacterium]|nr:F420-dependent NADP oxidoreductase [Chlorobiota bacterium]
MSWFEFVQNVPCSAPLAFRIGIIGAGRVGGALARALSSHLAWIVARSPWRRAELRQFLQQTPIVGSLDEIAVAADVIIISVPDRAISAIAGELARCFSDQLEGKVLVHLSGALTATELAAAAAFGALAISAHPFTMVPTSDPAWLYGAMWGIEGNPRAFPFIEAIVHAVGGTPYVLGPTDAKRKALYHAAAVLASNVTTEVVALAQEVARLAGIPPERFLPPI